MLPRNAMSVTGFLLHRFLAISFSVAAIFLSVGFRFSIKTSWVSKKLEHAEFLSSGKAPARILFRESPDTVSSENLVAI